MKMFIGMSYTCGNSASTVKTDPSFWNSYFPVSTLYYLYGDNVHEHVTRTGKKPLSASITGQQLHIENPNTPNTLAHAILQWRCLGFSDKTDSVVIV